MQNYDVYGRKLNQEDDSDERLGTVCDDYKVHLFFSFPNDNILHDTPQICLFFAIEVAHPLISLGGSGHA